MRPTVRQASALALPVLHTHKMIVPAVAAGTEQVVLLVVGTPTHCPSYRRHVLFQDRDCRRDHSAGTWLHRHYHCRFLRCVLRRRVWLCRSMVVGKNNSCLFMRHCAEGRFTVGLDTSYMLPSLVDARSSPLRRGTDHPSFLRVVRSG